MDFTGDREVDYTQGVNGLDNPNQGAQKTVNSAISHAKWGAPSTVLGAMEVIGKSVWVLDEDSNAVGNLAKNINDDLGLYYESNKDAAQIAGTLAATFTPYGVISTPVKLIQKGSWAWEMVNKLEAGKKISPYIFTSGDTVMSRSLKAASFAKPEWHKGKRSVEGSKPLKDILSKGRIEGAVDVAKESIAAEAMMYLTLSESDLFFPDGEYTLNNAMFNAAITGAFSGGASLANNYGIKKAVDAIFVQEARRADANPTINGEDILRRVSENLSKPGMAHALRGFAIREVDDILEAGVTKNGTELDAEARKVLQKKAAVYKGEAERALKHLGIKTPEGIKQAEKLDKQYNGFFSETSNATEVTGKEASKFLDEIEEALNLQTAKINKPDNSFIVQTDGTMLSKSEYKRLAVLEDKKAVQTSVSVDPFFDKKSAVNVKYRADQEKRIVRISKSGALETDRKINGVYFDDNGADYLAADKFVQRLLKGGAITADNYLSKLQHYSIIDVALETKDLTRNLTEAHKNALRYQSLSQKYQVFKGLINKKNGMDSSQIAQILNLPANDLGFSSPVISLFAAWANNGVERLENHIASGNIKFILGSMKGGIGREPSISDLTGVTLQRGGLGDFDKIPALLVRAQEVPQYKVVEDLAENAVVEHIKRNEKLTSESMFYKLIGGIASSNPELLKMSTTVDGLIGDGLIGSGVVGFQKNRARASSPIQALGSLTQMTYGETQKFINKIVGPLQKELETLSQPANKHMAVEYSLFKSEYKTGWHLRPNGRSDGKVSYAIDPALPTNRKIFESMPDNIKNNLRAAFDDGSLELFYMNKARNGEYKPVVVSQQTQTLVLRYNEVAAVVLREMNALRGAKGLKEINQKSLHLPPSKHKNSFVGYMVRSDNEVEISFDSINKEEFVKRKEIMMRENPNLTYYSRDELMTIRGATEKEWGVLQDFTNAHLQTGSAKGKAGGTAAEIGLRVVSDDYAALTDSLKMLSRQAHELMFEPQLKHLKRMEQFAEFGDDAAKVIRGTSDKVRKVKDSTFREWEKTLLQQHPETFDTYKNIADFYDRSVQKISGALGKIRSTDKPKNAKNRAEEYAALQQSLGTEFNPFKTVDDYLKNTVGVELPHDLAKHATFFNTATYAATIGILDAGMAVLNYSSWAIVQPATIAALRMTAQEKAMGEAGAASWQARTGLISHTLSPNELGDRLAVANPMKLSSLVFKEIYSPDVRKFLKSANEAGHLDATLVESLNTFTAPVKGYRAQMLEKGVDGLSFMTRKSEKHTKILASATNYIIARKVAGMSEAEASAFAIRQMDQVVGNYQPFNKPKLYQGAVGLPLGLFTTWVTNYLQRLYGDIEGLRTNAAFWQVGLQASLLGGESLPGWDLMSNSLMATYDGQETLTARLDNSFGDAGDWVLYGALGNIPKLFGADDGIAIHTRGSIGAPALFTGGGQLTESIPSMSVVGDIGQLFLQSAKSMVVNKGWSTNDQLEILSNYGVNGSIKNAAEFALGYEVNRARELVNDDVMEFMPFVARLLELKTIKEVKTADALYAQKTSMMVRRNKMEAVNAAMRSAIRNGEMDGELFSDLMNQAVANGTPIQGLKSLLTRNVKSAALTKADRAAMEYINGYAENEAGARLFEIVND